MTVVEGIGAPYQILVSNPISGEVKTYECDDAMTVVNDLTTLALVHMKNNIREKTGVRTIFEVVAKPVQLVEEAEGNQEEKEEVKVKEPPKAKSAKAGSVPVPVIATVEEVKADATDTSNGADDTGK
jgi:hypothetical protein